MFQSQKFACPSCGQHVQCHFELAGSTINCPGCTKPMELPGKSHFVVSKTRISPPVIMRLKPPWYTILAVCVGPLLVIGVVVYTGTGWLLPTLGLFLLTNKRRVIRTMTKWWYKHLAKHGKPVTGIIEKLGAKRLLGERIMTVSWIDNGQNYQHELVASTQISTHFGYVEGGEVRLWVLSRHFWPNCHLMDALLHNSVFLTQYLPPEWLREWERPSLPNGITRLSP